MFQSLIVLSMVQEWSYELRAQVKKTKVRVQLLEFPAFSLNHYLFLYCLSVSTVQNWTTTSSTTDFLMLQMWN